MTTRQRTRIGVIGAGVMGQGFVRSATTGALAHRSEIVAVTDTNAQAATALAAPAGATAYTDAEQMLAHERLDAVYIAVPDHLHVAPFLAATAAGVAILVEKPLATNLADAQKMADAATAANIVARVNFSNHHNPPFVAVKEAIDRGDLGDIVGVTARLSNTIDYPTRHLRWAANSSVGWFLLAHVFDVVTWLTGDTATDVTAAGRKGVLTGHGIDTWDIVHAFVNYESGMNGMYESSWILPPSLPSLVDFNVHLIGTQGRVLVDTHHQCVAIATSETLTYPGTLDWTATTINAFLDDVEAGPTGESGLLSDGVANTALLVALHASLDDGGSPTPVPTAATVTLPGHAQ